MSAPTITAADAGAAHLEAGRVLADAVWRQWYADGSESAVAEAVRQYDVTRAAILQVQFVTDAMEEVSA